MAYDKTQFKSLIERVLTDAHLGHTKDAVNLLLGTAAVESMFGTYLRQIAGPARGAFQMEGDTFDWLKVKYRIWIDGIETRHADEMEYDLKLAIIMCRLKYLSIKAALPTNLDGYARYWKRYYNTPLGEGSELDFIKNYRYYVEF